MKSSRRTIPVFAAISLAAAASLFTLPAAEAQSAGQSPANAGRIAQPRAFSTAPAPTSAPDSLFEGQADSVTQVGLNRVVINKSGSQSETSIAVDPTNPRHLLAMSNDLASGATATLLESLNSGRSWVNAGLTLAPTFCYDTWIDFSLTGDAFVSYECSDQRIAYRKVGQTTWTKTTLTTAGSNPDRSMVIVDTNTTSPFINSVYIGYDDNGASNSAFLMYSRNGFGSWLRTPKINDTSTTIGVNAATAPDGSVYATWEDYTGKKIWVDRSTDGGATWGTDHIVTNYRMNTTGFFVFIPPQPSRGILPFPMTYVAPAGTAFAGRLYVVYTDTPAAGGLNTNIYLRFSDNGGVTFSAETKINDDVVNAYHFHPQISVTPNGTVGVSFYDTRDDQPLNHKTNQYISYSLDGGVTWTANTKASTAQSDASGPGNSNEYGDYQGIDAASNNSFFQIWTDLRTGNLAEDVYALQSKP